MWSQRRSDIYIISESHQGLVALQLTFIHTWGCDGSALVCCMLGFSCLLQFWVLCGYFETSPKMYLLFHTLQKSFERLFYFLVSAAPVSVNRFGFCSFFWYTCFSLFHDLSEKPKKRIFFTNTNTYWQKTIFIIKRRLNIMF